MRTAQDVCKNGFEPKFGDLWERGGSKCVKRGGACYGWYQGKEAGR